MTKTEEALSNLRSGKTREALNIFKTFRINFKKEEIKQIARASEMLNGYVSMYEGMGYKTDTEVEKALLILNEKYKEVLYATDKK